MKLIAHYLPQFHPTPENDEWWGKGFTEWTNVAKAKPLFEGHYQPHLPSDLGFYDLRLPEAREAQAELAKEYGIYGFCYYHYWFNGRRILQRPFEDTLQSGKPDFPFCLCWANENWTRRWDGLNKHILLEQKYSLEDDKKHMQSLLPALRDKRYIRINDKPVLLIYNIEALPDPKKTAEIWREVAKQEGIGDIYLIRVERFSSNDISEIGFDAAIEFAPDLRYISGKRRKNKLDFWKTIRPYKINHVFDYAQIVKGMLSIPEVNYKRFYGISPGWDNSPRRQKDALIIDNSTPELYRNWLETIIKKTKQTFNEEEQLIFINAWNEWGEGAHLEPDRKYGRQYLEATRQALQNTL